VRQSTLIIAALLLITASASAQESRQESRTGFTIFISDPRFESSHPGGSSYQGGFGVAFDYTVTPRFSADLSIATESHDITSFNSELVPRISTIRSYPIDAVGRYHFFTGQSRWKPYVGVGFRYVASPTAPAGVQPYSNRLSAEIDGGVVFEWRPSFGIVLDARELVRNSFSGSSYDPLFKPSVGVRWRF
jgi:outer membrane protein W